MEFANRLYELRKKAGLSQEELAAALEVTRQTVSKWETGDSTPDMAKLRAMGEFFCISLDALVLGREQGAAEATSMEKLCSALKSARTKAALRWAMIGAGVVLAVDAVSLIICLCMGWFPG